MKWRDNVFQAQEEKDERLQALATEKNVVLLAIVAPFIPARIAPRRLAFAELHQPEEFMVEEFVDLVGDKFNDPKNRPPLYLVLHSPGGT